MLSIERYRPPATDGRPRMTYGYFHESYYLGTERTLPMLASAFFMTKLVSKYDLIITSEYSASFAINLRLLLTFSRIRHVTIGLNQSRQLFKTRFSLMNRFIDFVFKRTDLVIVHSRREAQLFNQIHGIDAGRFCFSLWGYDLPRTTSTRFSNWPRPYACLVGRNNRDVDTFIAAVRGMDFDGIIVTSDRHLNAEDLPPNIYLFVDLSLDDTLDCIKNAFVNTVLLRDNERGAGHITAVTAMFSGTPQVYSDVEVIKDYLVDGVSAIAVALGDVRAVRSAIERLMNDPPYAARLRANATAYAERWLTNERASERIARALSRLMRGQKVETVDPEWLKDYERLSMEVRNIQR